MNTVITRQFINQQWSAVMLTEFEKNLIASCNTEELCAMYEYADDKSKMNWRDQATLRGWIMTALQKINEDAFKCWINCADVELSVKPSYFFVCS